MMTSIVLVIVTYYLLEKLGKKEINKSTLWKNEHSDFDLKKVFPKNVKLVNSKNILTQNIIKGLGEKNELD